MVPQSNASPRVGKITNWTEFFEALEDFETIVANFWDSELAPDLPPRLSTLGLQLAAWMTEKTPHDPTPMLDLMRAIQAKDPLGCMSAFRVPVVEVDKLLWRWWPTKELLIDAALAAQGEPAGESVDRPPIKAGPKIKKLIEAYLDGERNIPRLKQQAQQRTEGATNQAISRLLLGKYDTSWLSKEHKAELKRLTS
ncbi:hypothetical protein [Lacipirellula limnantheis]|uniref:Uncharacterized protein n=1 Tax=Lacipirellula limnantheis TaxID=2528024 RepID=A0A517U2I2_9BACT|nr:hypothetical protein [Lacipirellula limnantheis]QDT74838.1 hypothetical protein I41_40410 [Lacipirellula limnantheis]